jgi:NAD+ diphosphatase
MAFAHSHRCVSSPAPLDRCLVIQADRLLVRLDAERGVALPDIAALANWVPAEPTPFHVGKIDDQSCWSHAVADPTIAPPAGWEWHETRSLLNVLSAAQLHAISCARQLHWWQSRHRFCGCCGTPTVDGVEERVKRCPSCGALFFPAASPAMIVAITRGEKLLLAHNRNFRPDMFSLLAGFVEPGETLEQATTREVREEVGIEIAAPRYITSQPWPFPNSLMIGFRAEHRSGEICVDGKEIEQAGWFTRDALPEIPRVGTVARLLIDGWLNEHS